MIITENDTRGLLCAWVQFAHASVDGMIPAFVARGVRPRSIPPAGIV